MVGSDKLYEWRERLDRAIQDITARRGDEDGEGARQDLELLSSEIFETYLDELLAERRSAS